MVRLQTFSVLLNCYEEITSLDMTGGRACVVVLLRKSLAMQTSTVFEDPEREMDVVVVTGSSKASRLIEIYVSCAGRQHVG